MKHLDLRKKYFDFWTQTPRNSVIVPSSSLVPENDPTTLFTGSGMQPLIPYLLGEKHPLGNRIVDIQKCFRGQDIDEVGDNRHDSFFEMMGNWSLGDYFKDEQIPWYFEFLTKELGFSLENLYATCFEGNDYVPKDTYSADIWKKLGFPEERIFYYSGKSNWWSRSGPPEKMPVGEIGGPSSEVFYEFTHVPHDPKFGEKCHPNCDCGRFIEIGNCVFITYKKTSDGFEELKQKNVDFGGGIERTLAALNNDMDVFKTDVFSEIIKTIEKISGQQYGGESKDFRIVADHIRSATFLISAGVLPSNTDRGYVLRRLIRRAIRYSKNLGVEENFIEKVVDPVAETYAEVYPELLENKINIKEVISKEETKFRNTLSKGLKEFEKLSASGELSAEEVFYLYESFGFPYELTEEEGKAKNIKVATKEEYDEAYSKHKEKSRTASQGMFKGGLADHSDEVVKYHTATHLLQAALRKVLGNGVRQEGSNLTGERLRFDFSYPNKLTPEEIKQVEDLINKWISEGLERKVETMTYEEAIKEGAMAFFKEKYPEKVTVYSFGDVSKEICGGPHVQNTKEIGQIKIIKEEAVSSGIRRVYAKI